MRTTACVLIALALSGCGSSDAPDEADVAAADEEVETEEARRARELRKRSVLPPHHVKFTIKNADLKEDILPLFQEQAGVRILWSGPARTVKRLRFTEPVHWKDALALVCQFTKTHLTRDYQGRLVLRNGWSGRLESDVGDRKGERGGSGPQAGRTGAPPRSRPDGGGRSGGRSAATWDNTYGGPSGSVSNAGDTAKRLLKGTTTTRSGGR